MTANDSGSSSTGKANHHGLLTTLAQSSNQWVQLATVALVALSGIGNWVATWNSADRNKNEIEINRRVAFEGEQRIKQEVVQQVAEIHDWMKKATEEFHQGNQDSAANKKILTGFQTELTNFEDRQIAVLKGQAEILSNQSEMLKELQGFGKEQKKSIPP